MQDITLQFIGELYEKYRDDLAVAREEQRVVHAGLAGGRKAQLDDLEAEITYLLLRAYRPASVLELGTFHGWSTTWLLRALRDNGAGRLYSFDLVDHVRSVVPAGLAGDRWTFVAGDARANTGRFPAVVDYLFVDAAHTAGFARWYLAALVDTLAPGTPVSVHDVFHRRRPFPFSEGAVVLGRLRRRGIPHFTASRAAAPTVHRDLLARKRRIGLAEPIHRSTDNPMLFFTTI